MESASAWFEDETQLERELRLGYLARHLFVSIPGYAGLEEIGEGGQATVYRATQESTGRTVAVKVFHALPGRYAPARRRFEREVELVSSLRHPSIVTVHDGGVTPEGRPYLVMEYVEGRTLDDCDVARRLLEEGPTPERVEAVLRLVLGVVDAVAHAHLHGVIHRDLKPANILVGEDGAVRVLDFGLARFSAGDGTATLSRSFEGSFAGSLPWASPEQARGEVVDVRSDVYSLGVILFELLAGRRPYDIPNDLRSALAAVAEPTPKRLGAVVPGIAADVEAVVGQCLALERARRYQSASELARDIERLLSGEAIDARRDSGWYVLRKRIRRWRRALIVAAIVVVLLAAALAFALVALRSAREAGKRASHEVERVRTTLDWVVRLMSSVDPDVDGKDARVVDLLDRTAPELDVAFQDDPESRVLLRATIAVVYEKLGRWDTAEAAYRRQLEDIRVLRGETHRETLVCRANILRMNFYRRRNDEDVKAIETLVAEMSRHLGAAHPDTVKARCMLAVTHRASGRFADAGAIWRAILSEIDEDFDPVLRLTVEDSLAALASLEGRPEEALERERRVLEERVRLLGPDHLDTLAAKSELSFYLSELAQFDEAEALGRELETKLVQRLGEAHPRSLLAVENLAKLLQDRGHNEEALPRFERVYALRVEKMGPEHRQTLVTMNNVSVARSLAGDVAGSLALDLKRLEILRRTAPPDAFDVINTLNGIGAGLCLLDRAAEGLPYHQEAVERADRSLGLEHWMDATFRVMLGNCLRRLERREEAETVLLAAHEVLNRVLGEAHPNTAQARSVLAGLYTAWGRPADAARWAPAESR